MPGKSKYLGGPISESQIIAIVKAEVGVGPIKQVTNIIFRTGALELSADFIARGAAGARTKGTLKRKKKAVGNKEMIIGPINNHI